MITYDWNCKTVDAYIEKEGNADVVYNVHWRVTGISDQLDPEGNNYSATNIGTQSLDVSKITNFIPWDEVTEAEVEEWTKAAMGEEQVLSIETNVAASLEQVIKPTSITLTIGEPA
jgi:hypothetical protein